MSEMRLKTIEDWQSSECRTWNEYCKPGDLVDQGVVDYFLNILPPKNMSRCYFQAGEPQGYATDPETKTRRETYATFTRSWNGAWCYNGTCFLCRTTDVNEYRKRSSVKEFLHETYKLSNGIEQTIRPRIFCNDGFKMSVQAGSGWYCTPRINLESGDYAECEVGYPSEKEELLMPYIEDIETEATENVYAYVPIEVIEKVIEKHGGWFDSRIPFV